MEKDWFVKKIKSLPFPLAVLALGEDIVVTDGDRVTAEVETSITAANYCHRY